MQIRFVEEPDPVRKALLEIFTALLFAQRPDYFKRIQELQQINLRI